MGRATLILNNDWNRRKAVDWVGKAPPGTRIEFKASKRTLPQNDHMWALLTDVSQQQTWHGIHLSPDDWKLLFMDALNSELRIVPNLDGTGFVNLGRSSSKLSKGEMSDLIELIFAFGAKHEIEFTGAHLSPVDAPVPADGDLAHQSSSAPSRGTG